ncbi:putative transcription regulator (modular protein) [Mesorhizobium plurifarium]|uniref:Putative transcription regulator (Modular protein) n=1 Tax=Mesorhizobium plurifarium TaxID=69974 RepID=A0A090FBA5_MESPL|nr:putative transcription regulator (modular protein) [Mesorhizobium plurifarium]
MLESRAAVCHKGRLFVGTDPLLGIADPFQLFVLTQFRTKNRQVLFLELLRGWQDRAMKAFFVQIKCDLGKAYEVASALADAEIASEIYSTAGNYDLLAKFYVDDEEDVGHFVNERVQILPGIKDTFTIVTFRAF